MRKTLDIFPEERKWMSGLLKDGYVDTFRYVYPEKTKYSWWSYRFKSRKKILVGG